MLSRIAHAVVTLTLLQGCATPPAYYTSNDTYYGPSSGQVPIYAAEVQYTATPQYQAPYAPLLAMHGSWVGYYSCNGERRKLDLVIMDPASGREGYGVTDPMTRTGRSIFTVSGSVDAQTGMLQITPARFINRAENYQAIRWDGSVQPDGTFAGNAIGQGCAGLKLSRTIDPDTPAFVSGERNPRRLEHDLVASEKTLAMLNTPPPPMTTVDRFAVTWGACVYFGGCPMPNLLNNGASSTSGGSSEIYTPPDQERLEKLGPNDFRSVPQIVSPTIKSPTIQ